MGLLALAGCSMFDLWAGDPAVSLPDSRSWVVLPMRSFVSRENIRVDGLQLCTRARCGYEAAIERFSVTGPDALAIEKSLADPKAKSPPPEVRIDSFGSGNWKGIELAMTGGKKSHQLSAYAVGQRRENGASFILVIAREAEVAKKLIAEATQ